MLYTMWEDELCFLQARVGALSLTTLPTADCKVNPREWAGRRRPRGHRSQPAVLDQGTGTATSRLCEHDQKMQHLGDASLGISRLYEMVRSTKDKRLNSLWEVTLHLLNPRATERWTRDTLMQVFSLSS